jgi:glycogen(starch) synthase
MHVLVTADTLGGVWTYVRELVTGMVRGGVRVTLVSFGEIPSLEQTDWMQGLAGLDYRPRGFRLEWMQASEADVLASSEYLLAVIEEVRPDILHLNQYCYGALCTGIPKIVVAHSDVVSWWVAVHGTEPPDSPWMRTYRSLVTRGLSGANLIVAPSKWMLQQIRRYYGQFAASKVIYNGRSPGLFNPYSPKSQLVASVGRIWDAGKQLGLLLRHDHNIPVAIIGSDEHPDPALRSQTRPWRSLRSKVTFYGSQPHSGIASLLSRASIYAVTSRYEPFGLAPLEAALSGCALVANDIPSLREIWGSAAYYFESNDAQSLARAIEVLAFNPDLQKEYAGRALFRAHQRYTAQQMVENYLELYTSLVGGSCSVELGAALS